MTKDTIEVLVDGGNANPGPPLGPALGPLGVNTANVVNEINEKTKDFSGMKIPIKVIVDLDTKEFEVEVGSPPTAALIKKELGVERGSSDGNPVGDLRFKQIMKIADMKKSSILANDITTAINEVVGTCQSVNVTIENRSPKEIMAEISRGLLDDVIAGKTEQMPDIVIKKEEVKIVGAEEEPEKPVEEEKEGAEGEEGEGEEGEGEEGEVKEDKGKERGAKGKRGKDKSEKFK